jgi:ATP-dependent Clp protease ATP-binding subunit ClpC
MSYEKFSDRARKVMQLASQECQKLNQEYVGTEHILLALCKEGSGCAAVMLRSVNIDFCIVRNEILKITQPGPNKVIWKCPLTGRAHNVIIYALEESRKMNLNYVGTEHILLGLLREEEGVACQILKNLGLGIDSARQHVYNLLGFCEQKEPNNRLTAKEEFKEYLKLYDRNEYDVNMIFREWMFEKLDKGNQNVT